MSFLPKTEVPQPNPKTSTMETKTKSKMPTTIVFFARLTKTYDLTFAEFCDTRAMEGKTPEEQKAVWKRMLKENGASKGNPEIEMDEMDLNVEEAFEWEDCEDAILGFVEDAAEKVEKDAAAEKAAKAAAEAEAAKAAAEAEAAKKKEEVDALLAEFKKEDEELNARFVAKFVALGLDEETAKAKVAEMTRLCGGLIDLQVKAAEGRPL